MPQAIVRRLRSALILALTFATPAFAQLTAFQRSILEAKPVPSPAATFSFDAPAGPQFPTPRRPRSTNEVRA